MNKLKNDKHFLYDYQYEAVKNMKNGCILNGGVGSGKSRTAIYYYFTKCGGIIDIHEYKAMTKPKSLYIITTARKRDTLEWEGELAPFLLTSNKEISIYYNLTVVVDSWNNIKKYQDVKNAFFIFDEQRVVGYGEWTKTFLEIAKNNEWILLSATPGDCWTDYIPVFIANGFYRNKSEFMREHAIFSRFTKYPKIDRFVNTKRLIHQRDDILINMDFIRTTEDHHIDVLTTYNRERYKEAIKTRWNPYRNLPMQQASDRRAAMKTKRILLAIVCLLVILGCLNYLLQQSPIPIGTPGSTPAAGAAQFVGKHDIKDSPYFKHPDFYNMQSDEHLTILPKFATTQQITHYTCGPAAANMVVKYYKGQTLDDELAVAKIMGSSKTAGTNTKGMVNYFEKIGWEVHSSIKDKTPDNYKDFLKFVESNLKHNTPIIVENVDWGGHWRVIIGYDSMGTAHQSDDVLIMADPYDTTDHLQDGYGIVPAERFFYMWFDHQLFPQSEQKRQWLTAKPKA